MNNYTVSQVKINQHGLKATITFEDYEGKVNLQLVPKTGEINITSYDGEIAIQQELTEVADNIDKSDILAEHTGTDIHFDQVGPFYIYSQKAEDSEYMSDKCFNCQKPFKHGQKVYYMHGHEEANTFFQSYCVECGKSTKTAETL